MRKYKKKIENIPEEYIVSVPPEIAVLILDRLSYTSNEELSNAFIKLLINASSSETIGLTHPGFIRIIDSISVDEARIIDFLSNTTTIIACIIIKKKIDKEGSFHLILENITNLKLHLDLLFPKNINLYLDNLVSLGIIVHTNRYAMEVEEEFCKIINENDEFIDSKFLDIDKDKISKVKLIERTMYELTNYGAIIY